MDIITIDPSLTCTAVVINNAKYVYVARHVACTPSGSLKRWFREVENSVTLRIFDLKGTDTLTHSDHEMLKFTRYSNIVDCILKDIKEKCQNLQHAKVVIEGYSYASSSGPLIDLVTFGTVLRCALFATGIHDINVISPRELKMKAASLAYGYTKTRANKYTNNDGKAAGTFTKKDMMNCLFDLDSREHDEWIRTIAIHRTELLSLKAVPKPLEDINDATLLYRWVLSVAGV